MIKNLQKKLFGSPSDKLIKKISPLIEEINKKEASLIKLSDDQLRAKTAEFKEKVDKGASLENLLVEAFAVCREAGARVLNMRHFDVQLLGGIALHRGMIAEMKTGEGKTLSATLPCYLNALNGKGSHVITVNDYLAQRDSEWMGQIHRFLGLEVGCITNDVYDEERKNQYLADVTYGTNNEFGFDYLRDNMKPSLDLYVQRELNFAIVDEVDSILIDEARTPLIISGPSGENIEAYFESDKAVRQLKRDLDYVIDEKARSVSLTEEGVAKLEKILAVENLFAPDNIDRVHFIHASMKAHAVFKRDTDYVVRDGEIMIVDEYTGRLMPGRRWSDGIHQAIEAKEAVKVQSENQTLATITLQNYFRMYNKLSGMTGTAETEEEEFSKVYGLKVLVIPSNKPIIRNDFNDLVYRNEAGKYRAVIRDIKEQHEANRPILVGTVSVAKSERVSTLLSREGIPHNVLNAKFHKSEAEIITEAGQGGSVTIATNMAGRGTDIILGDGIAKAGGLHVIGTERHESRRIDNQLRGRAGRQGDPGSSRFYLSLEDDLMRIFANETVVNIMDRIGMDEDEPIEAGLVTKQIAKAQKRVELHNFDIREQILKYDDVLNKQREVIYELRRQILDGNNLRDLIKDLTFEFSQDIVSQFCYEKVNPNEWNWEELDEAIKESFNLAIIDSKKEQAKESNWAIKASDLAKWISEEATKSYTAKVSHVEDDLMRDVERHYLIQSLDHHWKDHLYALDKLREGIHLRGYAQKDPLLEYRKEGYSLFKQLDKIIKQSALTKLFKVQIKSKEEQEAELRAMDEEHAKEWENDVKLSGPTLDSNNVPESPDALPADVAEAAAKLSEASDGNPKKIDASDPAMAAAMRMLKEYQRKQMQQLDAAQASGGGAGPATEKKPQTRNQPKVGRNDPCPCGSGKKYKSCHGKA